MGFQTADNAPVESAERAKAECSCLDQRKRDLDGLGRECVPVLRERFPGGYRWRLIEVEYSFDLVWRRSKP
ncbi:MAG: hypothetical protein H7A45_19605 [Verrucomicrobiales bacterium]|nr:hypothetical protein [Verrucomicrobiales bacterium]MCP5525715.1 hypothetical protein [Verrucomicrobiales bacterium]